MSCIPKLVNYPENFPLSWASGWGEDEFGLWMAFSYKGHRQQFRWCEPGGFLMGSPPHEPERRDDETQSFVTFNEGFWIADTTVTIGLWDAVLGRNPSGLNIESRPVEKISWNDSQFFIKSINLMNPELKLCLPTESQWEYACRAGSTTPFCWGEKINSDLVNFRGEVPYDGGQVSEFRKETVDVKSFRRNNWGLWQMHGNVWELCEDLYFEGATEPLTDSVIIGDERVLRGGSWDRHGKHCRSACRGKSAPDYRRSGVGFRLALSE